MKLNTTTEVRNNINNEFVKLTLTFAYGIEMTNQISATVNITAHFLGGNCNW